MALFSRHFYPIFFFCSWFTLCSNKSIIFKSFLQLVKFESVHVNFRGDHLFEIELLIKATIKTNRFSLGGLPQRLFIELLILIKDLDKQDITSSVELYISAASICWFQKYPKIMTFYATTILEQLIITKECSSTICTL